MDGDTKQLWMNTLAEVEITVSKANFTTWFKNTNIIKEEGGIVYVSVPNEFVKDWIINKYHKFILKTLRNLSDSIRGLEYVVSREEARVSETPVPRNNDSLTRELPLHDLYINKDDNLNPRYVFDSFIIGAFNELAYTAAKTIVEKPVLYNPLFIYGGTGLGKTHLIQAVGNEIKNKGNKKVYYITSEKFTVDCVTAIQSGKTNFFKEKYRKYDVLIIDDVQFFSGKERTQEELFHLFNELYNNNKQIIFSSDKHPTYIPNLEDRLKSRFSAGMTVDVSLPEYESRLAILKTKAGENSFNPPGEIIEYIASLVQGNIRELEGALNSIICQSQLKNRDLNLQEVKALIKNNIRQKKSISIKEVIKIISDFYGVEEDNIYEKTRRKDIVKPRQVAMYLLREDFSISFPSIGQKMGGRDHTTVIHSCDKVKNDLKTDSLLMQELEQIRALF
ncbi:MAG: chromosomal replication initiator protein DnaA [Candidatus Paceibacterota bacterium]